MTHLRNIYNIVTVNKEIHKKMTRYTESIKANANKTEKEQLVSLMEKFNISVYEAMDILIEELGESVYDSLDYLEAYRDLEDSSKEKEITNVVDYENLGEDW